MSMTIVHHVLGKSQTQGSARTLLLTLAIHANGCCGVAWVSDTTLRHEVNVSRQRIHELKNVVEASGELIIVERPGYTNLYFVAWQGQPVGGQGRIGPHLVAHMSPDVRYGGGCQSHLVRGGCQGNLTPRGQAGLTPPVRKL